MKIFTNLKMYKSLVIAFMMVFAGIFNSYGQTTVTIYPDNSSWWTGSVYYVSGTYSDKDDDLKIGHADVAGNYRAYIAF